MNLKNHEEGIDESWSRIFVASKMFLKIERTATTFCLPLLGFAMIALLTKGREWVHTTADKNVLTGLVVVFGLMLIGLIKLLQRWKKMETSPSTIVRGRLTAFTRLPRHMLLVLDEKKVFVFPKPSAVFTLPYLFQNPLPAGTKEKEILVVTFAQTRWIKEVWIKKE